MIVFTNKIIEQIKYNLHHLENAVGADKEKHCFEEIYSLLYYGEEL